MSRRVTKTVDQLDSDRFDVDKVRRLSNELRKYAIVNGSPEGFKVELSGGEAWIVVRLADGFDTQDEETRDRVYDMVYEVNDVLGYRFDLNLRDGAFSVMFELRGDDSWHSLN